MRAVVIGVEPEQNYVTLDRKTLTQITLARARVNMAESLCCLPDHCLLYVAHIVDIGI